MNNIENRINASLAKGAEYLAMGEIAANTGLRVCRNNMSNFCRMGKGLFRAHLYIVQPSVYLG
ncbi:hypothetical protein [Methyloprofundus sedimenti]|nr:hypothetical protein [Methyloprofundus sedimenti]